MAKLKKKKENSRVKVKTKQHNRQYKDSLFRIIFRSRKDLLQLYNALNDTDYEDEKELEITTLDGGTVQIGIKNDTSFVIGATLNLYEHQSTKNPNMPIRGLLYLSTIYREYIDKQGLDMYGSKLLALPLPQYFVFYNGTKEEPDRSELHLTEAFWQSQEGHKSCIDCKAVMLNINYGHNEELMKRCSALWGYSVFVDKVRNCLSDGMELECAVDLVIEKCIEEGILTEILKKYRREVKGSMLIEFNEELHRASEERYRQEELAKAKEEAMKAGRAEGIVAGREEGIAAGRAEGLAAGRSVGFTEGRADAVLELLEDVGCVPEDIRKTILNCRDTEVLKTWLKSASKADSVEEFIEQM